MLSKKAIDALRKQAQREGMAYQRKLIEHIDVLQAQLDKLQEDYTAQSLALKAAKAMQQAETDRADAAEARVDSLMMEFCHEEMSKEQMEKWASHQVAVGRNQTTDATNHATIQPLSTKE